MLPVSPPMNAKHLPACTTAWLEDAVMPIAEVEASQDEITIEDDVETENVKMAPDPGQPTPQQLEDHRRLHLPYRQWCKWCVQGRGRGSPHTRAPASNIAVIGVDYFFITSGGVATRTELDQAADDEGEAQLEEAR